MLLLIALYGSYRALTGKPYQPHSWQYYFHLLSAWVLLFASLKAWHRCYTWRRVSAKKNITPHLSRGMHQPLNQKERPGILEYASLILFLMAITAILKQLGIANIPWLIGSTLGSYFMLGLAIRGIR